MPAQSPPSTPTGRLTAKAGDGSVILKWQAVEGATEYHVFRSIDDVWDAEPLARVTGTTYTNDGLTNGTTYSYKVAAVTEGGTTILAVVSAKPSAQVTELTASAADAQAPAENKPPSSSPENKPTDASALARTAAPARSVVAIPLAPGVVSAASGDPSVTPASRASGGSVATSSTGVSL